MATSTSTDATFKRETRVPRKRLTNAERLEERQAARQLAEEERINAARHKSKTNKRAGLKALLPWLSNNNFSNFDSNRSSSRNRAAARSSSRNRDSVRRARIRRRAAMEKKRYDALRPMYNSNENQEEVHRRILTNIDRIENNALDSNYDRSSSDGESVPELARNLKVVKRYSVTTKNLVVPVEETRTFEGTFHGILTDTEYSLSFTDIFWVNKTGAASRTSLERLDMRPNDIKRIRLIPRTD